MGAYGTLTAAAKDKGILDEALAADAYRDSVAQKDAIGSLSVANRTANDDAMTGREKNDADIKLKNESYLKGLSDQKTANREAASEAEQAAKRKVAALEREQEAMKDAADAADDLAQRMTRDADTAIMQLTQIGERHGQAINEALLDQAEAISRAAQEFDRALRDMEEREATTASTNRRRKELSERLSGEDRVFGQRLSGEDRIFGQRQADERYHHQEALRLTRIDEDEKKALLGARDARERQIIQITAQEKRDALRLEHMAYDEEVKFRLAQEDASIAHRAQQEDASRAHRARQDAARAELERALHDEELVRERTRIEDRKAAAILAADEEYKDRTTRADAAALADVQRVATTAGDSLKELKTNFLDKLPEAAAGGAAGLAALLDRTLGATIRNIWSTVQMVQAATGAGGGGGGGEEDPFAGVDPAHRPGGSIFDAWWASLSPEDKEDFKREHPNWGLARGGLVMAPLTARLGENAPRVPELVLPLDRAGLRGIGGDVTVHVTVQGNVMREYDLADAIYDRLLELKRRNVTMGLS